MLVILLPLILLCVVVNILAKVVVDDVAIFARLLSM